MTVDRDEVRRIARLAHLEYPRVQLADGSFAEPPEQLMSEAALDQLATEMNQLLEYVQQLSEVNVEGVEPTAHGVPLPTRLRKDEAQSPLPTEKALAAAPQRVDGAVSVPRVVE